jgi:imidazolonepropionase-like amidohydrolase
VPEVLTAPRLITGDETVTDGAVVISGDLVQWAGPAHLLPGQYRSLPRSGYPDSTIMPGLIDSHVHLGFDGGPDPAARMQADTDEQQRALMLHSARELLGVGVTTARDLGARAYLAVAVRDAIAAGLAPGPRLVVAASPVTTTGGHCWFMGGEADSLADLRRIVRAHSGRGTDVIKVMATGGLMTAGTAPGAPQYTVAQLAVIVEEAARAGQPVAAHAHGTEGISWAVEAGVSTVEHCSFVAGTGQVQFSEPLAARMAEQGTFVCPTINVSTPRHSKVTGIRFGAYVKELRDVGVRIIAGTDAGIFNTPHRQYVSGLEHMVRLGLEPADVLVSATTSAAAALGLGAVTGRLAPGYAADLIVVDGDPQADIAALRQLRRVIARGQDHAPAALAASAMTQPEAP